MLNESEGDTETLGRGDVLEESEGDSDALERGVCDVEGESEPLADETRVGSVVPVGVSLNDADVQVDSETVEVEVIIDTELPTVEALGLSVPVNTLDALKLDVTVDVVVRSLLAVVHTESDADGRRLRDEDADRDLRGRALIEMDSVTERVAKDATALEEARDARVLADHCDEGVRLTEPHTLRVAVRLTDPERLPLTLRLGDGDLVTASTALVTNNSWKR